MPTSRSIDRRSFLDSLRESGLLTAEQLEEATRLVPESNRGRLVARALVSKGLLTRFQAEQVLAGRTSGFSLGQYRILDLLGEGGMGRVFKAQHVTMNRVVALKVLTPSLLKTARAQDLFMREVRLAAQLVHQNIVTAFDANQINGRCYLVLEYVDGPNLDQLVRDYGPLPIGAACEMIRQIAVGLQFAQHKKMVHRDIKPANLLLLRTGNDTLGMVKISDFGLAGLHDAEDAPDGSGSLLTKPNTVMGTPDFVSPEQAKDVHSADIRSDLYSLGCTFYYLLTGNVPFPDGSAMEKLVRHAMSEPEAIEKLRPDVPVEVASIVRRLMKKKPEDRYQSPTELEAAVAPWARNIALSGLAVKPAHVGDDLPEEAVAEEVLAQGDSVLVGTVPPSFAPTALSTDVFKKPRRSLAGAILWWGMLIVAVGALGLAITLGVLAAQHAG